MSKHSDGPWKKTHSALTGFRVSDSSGWGVAVVLKDTNDEANAQLIAAAPAMLEALEKGLDVLAICRDSYLVNKPLLSQWEILRLEEINAAIRINKAAISAAKGGAI